ncbi:MAG: AAA family ATPase [Planctomycetota bacterium]
MPTPELVVFVGLQGAGKTSFYRAAFASSHALVSKDRFPNARRPATRQAREVEAALAAGRSVVVDNTNPTRAERAALIALGRRHRARVVGYFFRSELQACLARNAARSGRARIPDKGLFATRARLELPAPDEGFDALYYVAPERRRFAVSRWRQP